MNAIFSSEPDRVRAEIPTQKCEKDVPATPRTRTHEYIFCCSNFSLMQLSELLTNRQHSNPFRGNLRLIVELKYWLLKLLTAEPWRCNLFAKAQVSSVSSASLSDLWMPRSQCENVVRHFTSLLLFTPTLLVTILRTTLASLSPILLHLNHSQTNSCSKLSISRLSLTFSKLQMSSIILFLWLCSS